MQRQVTIAPTFADWQQAARQALASDWGPGSIVWAEVGEEQSALGLFSEKPSLSPAPPSREFRVPRDFVDIARRVACHRDPERWAWLYEVLWRLTHGEPRLMEITVDPAVYQLVQMDKAVRRAVHKMRAFVRFREVQHEDGPWFVSWFEPEHHVVELNESFFRGRFASMRWSILTPLRCMHWDGETITYTEGVPRSAAPQADTMEHLWRTYYGHIFNPARVKTKAMQKEMPKYYWKNLPEASLIPRLLEEAPKRVEKMLEQARLNKKDAE